MVFVRPLVHEVFLDCDDPVLGSRHDLSRLRTHVGRRKTLRHAYRLVRTICATSPIPSADSPHLSRIGWYRKGVRAGHRVPIGVRGATRAPDSYRIRAAQRSRARSTAPEVSWSGEPSLSLSLIILARVRAARRPSGLPIGTRMVVSPGDRSEKGVVETRSPRYPTGQDQPTPSEFRRFAPCRGGSVGAKDAVHFQCCPATLPVAPFGPSSSSKFAEIAHGRRSAGRGPASLSGVDASSLALIVESICGLRIA